MGFTAFIQRHTRHATPVLVAGLAYIGAPFLVTLDENLTHMDERLKRGEGMSYYDGWRPWIKASVVMLGALGAFMSREVDERRKKLVSETEWIKQEVKK